MFFARCKVNLRSDLNQIICERTHGTFRLVTSVRVATRENPNIHLQIRAINLNVKPPVLEPSAKKQKVSNQNSFVSTVVNDSNPSVQWNGSLWIKCNNKCHQYSYDLYL